MKIILEQYEPYVEDYKTLARMGINKYSLIILETEKLNSCFFVTRGFEIEEIAEIIDNELEEEDYLGFSDMYACIYKQDEDFKEKFRIEYELVINKNVQNILISLFKHLFNLELNDILLNSNSDYRYTIMRIFEKVFERSMPMYITPSKKLDYDLQDRTLLGLNVELMSDYEYQRKNNPKSNIQCKVLSITKNENN